MSWRSLMLGIGMIAVAGCEAPPRVMHPGTAEQQQARAQRFDPYPDQSFGPPIAGGRPLDYQSPPPEILHVQPRRDEPSPTPSSVAVPPGNSAPPYLPPQ